MTPDGLASRLLIATHPEAPDSVREDATLSIFYLARSGVNGLLHIHSESDGHIEALAREQLETLHALLSERLGK